MTLYRKYPQGTSEMYLKNKLTSLKNNGFKYMAWYGFDKCFNIQLIDK